MEVTSKFQKHFASRGELNTIRDSKLRGTMDIGPFDVPHRDFSKWETIRTLHVKPETAREAQWLEWGSLDTMWLGFYSSFFFLYEPKSQDPDAALPMDILVKSLSKVLVPFYPLAGRLFKQKGDKRPKLHCGGEGALFLHKKYDAAASELIDEPNFRPNELISGLYEVDPKAEEFPPSGLPALLVHVTDFQCGTRCLSTSWSHAVADGFSGAHFLQSWAQVGRGESISLMPVIDRSLLSPRESSPILDNAFFKEGGNEGKANVTMRTKALVVEGGVGCKTIRVSREMMDELKAEASKSSDTIGQAASLSSLDCLSAFLWRSITSSRNLEPHELTTFMTLVNCRSRVKDLPAGYFGNCLLAAMSTMRADELLSKPLNRAATTIHNAIQAVDEALVRNMVDLCSVKSLDELKASGFSEGLLRVSFSWQNRFPFFELDFGSGQPVAVIRNAVGMSHSNLASCFGLPTSSADIAVSIFAENHVLEKLSTTFS